MAKQDTVVVGSDFSISREQWRRARQQAAFAPLLGKPCIACGQPALFFIVQQQAIKHVNGDLPNCDAGAR